MGILSADFDFQPILYAEMYGEDVVGDLRSHCPFLSGSSIARGSGHESNCDRLRTVRDSVFPVRGNARLLARFYPHSDA